MKNFVRALMFVAVLLTCGTACKQNQTNQEPENYSSVEQKPMFNGEDAGKFATWVFGQIKYPEEAYKNDIQGRVVLQFTIAKDGKVTNVKILRSSGNQLLDDEAVRVVSMSPQWEPGKHNGKPVDVVFTFPVVFKLEGEKTEAAGEAVAFAEVEQKPTFMGDEPVQFTKWVFGQLKYPEEAKEKQIQGRVTLQFTIAKDGKVKDINVARSSGSQILDDEAVRIVSMSPQWEPGKHKGEPVDVRFTFPLVFKLR
jgi:TonB family protein